MMSDADRSDEAKRRRGSGPKIDQATKARQRHHDDQRHEPGRHLIGEPRNWRARALRGRAPSARFAPASCRAPTFSARMTKLPVLIERAADDAGARRFHHRHGFAGDHRFVDRRVPVDDDAVDRDFFAGTHPQAVSDGDVGKRNFNLAAIVGDPTRRLGREIEQGADGARRSSARARSSSTCPSSTSTVMTAAASK